MWGTRPTKSNTFMSLQHIPHKIWIIEDPIVILVSLYYHSLELSLAIKVDFSIDIFSSIYSHLMFDYRETTCMVNKDTYNLEHLRWIWLSTRVLDPTRKPKNVVIFRHHMSNEKRILIDFFLLHMIILNYYYFSGQQLNFSNSQTAHLVPPKFSTTLELLAT